MLIYDNEVASYLPKQFMVVFNLTNGTLAVPGINHNTTVTILDDGEKLFHETFLP